MFGHEAKPCKVYEYGCLQPLSGEDVLIAEISRKHKLWNALVEMERLHREDVRKLLAIPGDLIPTLLEELEALREQIKLTRKKERSGKVDISIPTERINTLKTQIKEEQKLNKVKRKAIIEETKPQLDQLDKERRQKVKDLCKASGLYWVNYGEVVNSYEQARRKAISQNTDLRFHRWDGTGKVTVRYQKGLPVPELFSNNTLLQIDPINEGAWYSPIRGERRKLSRTTLRFRATSENRKPVWVELPMVMHRPIPEDSEIRSASLVRERIGEKFRYKVVITATIVPPKVKRELTNGAVAIDLGWRMTERGLRVAYWADEHGNNAQLLLSNDILHEFNKVRDLQSIRDQQFNDIKSVLTDWLSMNDVPDWFEEDLKYLSQWRTPRKLAWLFLNKWKDNRFDGDTLIFEAIRVWRKQENHLFDWETNLRDQVHRRRREEYRKFSAWLVDQGYSTVVLEKFDLRNVTKKTEPEHGTQGTMPTDTQRTIASVSELRLALKNAFKGVGVELTLTDAINTTRECHHCGNIENFDAAKQIHHTCSKCGELYDQDHNAAIVLLRRVG